MSARDVTIACYLAVLVLALAAELIARRRLAGIEGLERALGKLRSVTAGRVLLLVVWAWLVWHLLAR